VGVEIIMTEQEVRALRDAVYGNASSLENWKLCRDNWMKPEGILYLQTAKQTQDKLKLEADKLKETNGRKDN